MSTRKRDTTGRKNLEWPAPPEPLPISIFDNHTHMDFEDGVQVLDVPTSLDRAAEVGIAGVIQVGTDVASSQWGVDLAHTDERVLAAVALHPNEAPVSAQQGTLEDELEQLSVMAADPRVAAVGETGLDFFRTEKPGQNAQFASFEAHIAIAKHRKRAMQIHDRDAHDDVVKTLLRVGAPEHTVFHCFSGTPELARICNDNGWMMSFAGTVTFKNAPQLREALRIADPELILVETDAPFLTPEPYRGRPNASYVMPHTVRRMAQERNQDLEELCQQIAQNTLRTYGKWEDRG